MKMMFGRSLAAFEPTAKARSPKKINDTKSGRLVMGFRDTIKFREM
jgi:hypothetical protein